MLRCAHTTGTVTAKCDRGDEPQEDRQHETHQATLAFAGGSARTTQGHPRHLFVHPRQRLRRIGVVIGTRAQPGPSARRRSPPRQNLRSPSAPPNRAPMPDVFQPPIGAVVHIRLETTSLMLTAPQSKLHRNVFGALDITGEHRRATARTGCRWPAGRLRDVGHLHDRQCRTEGLLGHARHRVVDVDEHGRRVEAALGRPLRSPPVSTRAPLAIASSTCRSIDRELVLVDQRAEVCSPRRRRPSAPRRRAPPRRRTRRRPTRARRPARPTRTSGRR